MQSNVYKKYYPFLFVGLIALGLIASLSSMTYAYLNKNDVKPTNTDEILEVKLPIMSWSQYSTLSKKYENGIVLPGKKLMETESVVETTEPEVDTVAKPKVNVAEPEVVK